MAGCVKIVDTKSPVSAEDAWMYDESLPVPVQLGVAGTETKAAINSIEDIRNRTFGLFAFDKAAADLSTDDGLMLRNLPATGVVAGSIGSLRLSEAYYYPIHSEREFSFYSYYAYPMKDVSCEITETQALVTIPVTGINDVLWAEAETEDGYNASYIRNGGAAPAFNYTHATACLAFKASISEAVDGTNVRLSSLKVVGPATATLCVADIADPMNKGTFVARGEMTEKMALTDGYSGNLNLLLSETPQRFCQDMFIVPGDQTVTVKASFVIRSAGSDGITDTSDDVIQNASNTVILRAGDDGEVFKAGYRYAYNLKMISPSELTFTLGDEDQIEIEGYEPAFK